MTRAACPPRGGLPRLLGWVAGLMAFACSWGALAEPSIALYYGPTVPVAQLAAFDTVVLEPDSGFDPRAQHGSASKWFAYVSVGEVTSHRAYYRKMPNDWITGVNPAWDSHVVDQAAEGWPAFYVDNVIAPLWAKGYRGFFLDTLDSYQLIAHTDDERVRQQAGLVAVIRAIKARYPRAKLIFNRGFELMPQVHELAYVVAFESLYRGWNQADKTYTTVPQADRDWLLGQAGTLREKYRLPVLAIDYCAPDDRACALDTVAKIREAGLIPYVTDGGLSVVGTAGK